MAPHALFILATLASLLAPSPCSASPDFAVPPLAVQGPSRLSPVDDSSSAPSQPLHAHLSRHRRRSAFSHDPRIEQRQVHNVREAARAWEKRDEVAKRASPSNVPKTGICLGTAGAYAQCGGLTYEGDTCCITGYTCTKSDDYYSQCRPSTTECANAFYGQCGGLTWMGATCCPSGSACVSSGPYYAQCVPGASSGSTSTTTSAAAQTSSSSTSSSASKTTTTTQAQTTTSSKTTTTTTSSTTTTTSSRTSTTTSSSAAPAPSCTGTGFAWGQCGGQTWTGATCCPSGYYCSYSGPYYSQCVPGTASSSTTTTTTTTTTSARPTSTTTTPASSSFSTVTRSSSSSATSSAPTATQTANTCSSSRQYAQCGGALYLLQETCCPTGYTCDYQSLWYSQCVPSTSASSSSSSSSQASRTSTATSTSSSTSSAPTATSTGKCKLGQAVSDGCIIYSLTAAGITLPSPYTFLDNGHVNYQAIPKSQYKNGETYLSHGSQWQAQSFNVHFESLNGMASGKYIGKNYLDFAGAQATFPGGYCVVWVQLGGTMSSFLENPHWGEGGQAPICT
ncbi:hypothetical protein JCM6882_000193 [Rhodosporidiobolus microsporus]